MNGLTTALPLRDTPHGYVKYRDPERGTGCLKCGMPPDAPCHAGQVDKLDYRTHRYLVVADAEVVEAPGCGPGISGFKSHRSPV